MTSTAQELLDAIGKEYGQQNVHPDALNHSAVNITYLERTFDWYMSLSDRTTAHGKTNYWERQAIRTMRRLLLWQQVRDYQAMQTLRAGLAESLKLLSENQAATNGLYLDMVQGVEE